MLFYVLHIEHRFFSFLQTELRDFISVVVIAVAVQNGTSTLAVIKTNYSRTNGLLPGSHSRDFNQLENAVC